MRDRLRSSTRFRRTVPTHSARENRNLAAGRGQLPVGRGRHSLGQPRTGVHGEAAWATSGPCATAGEHQHDHHWRLQLCGPDGRPARGRHGAVVQDRGELQRTFDVCFPGYCEVVAPGYSRRQHRDGEVSLPARIDRVWTNLSTTLLRDWNAQARYASSPLDPTLPSDHSALLFRLEAPRLRIGGRRPIPRWVSEHNDFEPAAAAMLTEISASSMDCWNKLRSAVEALHRAAREIATKANAPGPQLTASWQAHRLTTGLREWRMGHRAGVLRALTRFPDLLALFIDDGDALKTEIPPQAFADAYQHLTMRVTLEEHMRNSVVASMGWPLNLPSPRPNQAMLELCFEVRKHTLYN